MKLTHDKDADSLYVKISPLPVDRTIELGEGASLDLDRQGFPVGLEVLDWSKR